MAANLKKTRRKSGGAESDLEGKPPPPSKESIEDMNKYFPYPSISKESPKKGNGDNFDWLTKIKELFTPPHNREGGGTKHATRKRFPKKTHTKRCRQRRACRRSSN